MTRRQSNVHALLGKLAGQEQRFLAVPFLAPALPGAGVRVRLGGVVCKLKTDPREFRGWGVFQPRSFTSAALVREANLGERRGYLELLLRVRLVVCQRKQEQWLCCAASYGDQRLKIDGLVPVELAREVQMFDVIYARYDGATFWFEEADLRQDPRHAEYLRAALDKQTPPPQLDRPGLSAELRAAYELNLVQALEAEQARRKRDAALFAAQDPVRRRLRAQLSHAGAELVDYLERADGYRVTYTVGGRRMTSSVNKDLTVQVAGICLSGEDQKFDLGSLVGVLREGRGERAPRVGRENRGMTEEQYWHAHPRS